MIFCIWLTGIQAQQYIRIDASFYSDALDENRMVDIYLPGEYYLYPDQEYATIYYLHGGNGNQNEGNSDANWYYNTHYGDTSNQSPPAIFVCPDGSCGPYMGSMWANSELYGNFEDYIVEDVISFVEENFRAMPHKEFRFITGWSMGGMGSSNIAARHPDKFRACIPCIAGLSMPDTCLSGWRSGCYLENGSYNLSFTGSGFMTQVMFTICGAYSPNLNLPPYYVDIPFDTLGNWKNEVLDKWYEYDVSRRVKNLPDEDELAWFIICGLLDELYGYPGCLTFTDSLDAHGIAHDESYFEGGHEFDPASWMAACHWVDSIIDISYETLGIEVHDRKLLDFGLFPNPCTKAFTIHAEVAEPADVEVMVWDQSGHIVMTSRKICLQPGVYEQFIDVTGLAPGIYFCRLTKGDRSVTKKLVKVD